MSTKVLDPGIAPNEEDVQPLSEIMCNCELCYARLCVSARQNIEDDSAYGIDQADNFHIPAYNKPSMPYMSCASVWAGAPMCGDINSQSNFPISRSAYQMLGAESFLPMYPTQEWPLRSQMVGQMPCDADFGMTIMSPSPQLYLSKESVLHLRLSAYVALERSGTAFRLMNYRNNSALALSENGEYGYAYHYNCRGLINMHHEKLSITFDKDRQILLRMEKPSFVKKENEYYRLTSHHWTQCRPVSMDFFDRDRTPEILKKSGPDKSTDEAKLMDLINSSVMQKDANGLTSKLIFFSVAVRSSAIV